MAASLSARMRFSWRWPSVATCSGAAVLWDQSAISFSSSAPGIANSYYTGFGGGPFYALNDITVGGAGWNVTTITEYFSDWAGVDMNVKAPTGYLIVMPKTGAVPTGTPTTTTVPLTWVDTAQSGQGVYVMTAAGLNLDLLPGDYWITVAPVQRLDSFNGNNSGWPALSVVGSPVATYDGSWADHNIYGNYDSAFMLEGSLLLPTAAKTQSWGGLKALYR